MNDENAKLVTGKILRLPGSEAAQEEKPVQRSVNTRSGLAATLLQARAEFGEAILLVLRIRELGELAESFGEHCARQLDGEVRDRLHDYMRNSDPVFSLDKGEFAIVLPPHEELADIDHICERLVQFCSGHYRLDEVAPLVTAAVGVAQYPADANDEDDLVRFARIALRRAEAGSRNGFSYFSTEMLNRQRHRIRMEGELERALLEERFILQYQPQYTLDTHEIVGMEALVRMVTADGELVPPDQFIGIAEDNGFIVPLGHWVIAEACRQLSEWRRAGYDPKRIAVNVSARQLLDTRLSEIIEQAVSENGLRYTDLELEITESCILEHLPEASDILTTLRGRGVRIAIDDFGAGFSSFAALVQLPLDLFKMDRTFLDNVCEDPRAGQVVTAIIAMARQLGYQVIAEGIETPQQYRFLQGSGCELGQGFGLARPQDAHAIGRLFDSGESDALAG